MYSINYPLTHINIPESTGFDYVKIFETVENYGYEKLNNGSYTGGESTIVLLVTRTGLTEDQRTFLTQRKEVFNSLLPSKKIYNSIYYLLLYLIFQISIS